MIKELRQLQEALSKIPEGKISGEQEGTIKGVLADAWAALEGSSVESTVPEKLPRAESLDWRPPVSLFSLSGMEGDSLDQLARQYTAGV
jgi:hypothetical protein